MAGNERFDNSIGRWLQDIAPTQLPDHVLKTTFERTRQTRQDRPWRSVLARRERPRLAWTLGGAVAVVTAMAMLGVSFGLLGGLSAPPTSSPPSTTSPSRPPSPSAPLPTAPAPSAHVDTKVVALLNDFLEARIAGLGAGNFLNTPREDFPLLYATTSGAPYERAEYEPVLGYKWPYGFSAFEIRLFGGDTVVEQLVFSPPDGSRGLEYQPNGFGTDIAPTTENGLPVAAEYDPFGGEVVIKVAHPWILGGGAASLQLIPEGPIAPTTDGGERRDWDVLVLLADPVPATLGCRAGARAANAAALAESIQSFPELEATAPARVTVGSWLALVVDVVVPAGVGVCDSGVLGPVIDREAAGFPAGAGRASGDWLRLYLFDLPAGSSIRVLAIAISAPESRFERAVEAALPIVESVAFPAH